MGKEHVKELHTKRIGASEEVSGTFGENEGQRTLSGVWRWVFVILAFGLGFFHIYTAGFGLLPNIMQRAVHVGVSLTLAFALYPIMKGERREGVPIWDVVLMAISFLITVHLLWGYDRIIENATNSLLIDRIYGAALVLLILEAARRTIGLTFPVLVSMALLYAFMGSQLSGIWAHRGFSFTHVVEQLFMSTNGIWGPITAVSATAIASFVMLGTILLFCGGGQTFIDLSIWLAGRLPGGAAKVAVIASSLVATINGNGPANVATTGTLTIPMMKRLGYKPEMAGAVESVASTGGQIAPPIMGAGAFVMAELVGIPYADIALAAALPAFLFYLGAWYTVDFTVRRQKLKPVEAKDIPDMSKVLTWHRCGPLFIPLGLLLWAIFTGYSLTFSGFLACTSALAIYLFTSGPISEINARGMHCLRAITAGGKGMVTIAVLSAAAQIAVSLINMTGLAPKLSSFVVSASGGSLMVTLIISMIVGLIMGMGMPTVAAYILTTTIVGGALAQAGLDKLPAHMFMFYFAVISAITPPVCTSVYVAAALAGSNWLRTGWMSVGLGLSGFIVPFAFVSYPGLLLQGTWGQILWSLLTASLGVIAVSAAVGGYFVRMAPMWHRAVLLLSGLLLIDPNNMTDRYGLALLAAVWLYQMYLERRGGGKGVEDAHPIERQEVGI